MADDTFTSPLAFQVWDARYRLPGETAVADTWRRIAHALACVESTSRATWEQGFFEALSGFRFLPGGRILAGAGSPRRTTLFNCFVMGRVEDSMRGIFDALREGALTMQQGGGIGVDFSTLRPLGEPAGETGGVASGPVSFMRVWESMCATVIATNARRGAMMATLACDHPDIEAFIDAKAHSTELRHFNLSVLVSDAFMDAVAHDAQWALAFPCGDGTGHPGAKRAGARDRDARVFRTVSARALWERIMRASYAYAEPGVIFIDRVNAWNNLRYREDIRATNPCGEIPLPAYGACDLGSLNLPQFVRRPFTPEADVDWQALRRVATLAVRMLDDVYEISSYPLPEQRDVARGSRRVGLGITGLADALIMLGERYDGEGGRDIAQAVMREICHAAYRASIALARERGPFPAFDADLYLHAPFVQHLPDDIRAAIAIDGIRNSHLIAIAPTGSISLFANNVSSGLEPVFGAEYQRLVHDANGEQRTERVVDYAVARFRAQTGASCSPPAFMAAADVAPDAQLDMQAVLQEYVDNAISKTVSVPADFEYPRYRGLFERAYALGLKGCTTFRPNPVTGAVLVDEPEAGRCCAAISGECGPVAERAH